MHNEMNKMVSKLHNHKHNIYYVHPIKWAITHWLSTRKRVYTLNTQCTYPIICSGQGNRTPMPRLRILYPNHQMNPPRLFCIKKTAEAGGFEPPVRLPVRQFSKLLVSATHPNFHTIKVLTGALFLNCECKGTDFSPYCQIF